MRTLDWRLLPPELYPVDRVMQRWAVTQGSGLPTERWDDSADSRPPPLDDDMAYRVDRIVMSADPLYRRFLRLWYCTPIPEKQIARQLTTSRDELQLRWRSVLEWLRGQFQTHGVRIVECEYG